MGQSRSFGDIKVEEVKAEGRYPAHVVGIFEVDTQFGPRAMWAFVLEEDDQEVVGFSSWSFSSQAKLVAWAAAALNTDIPGLKASGKGTEDLGGLPVNVVLAVKETKNRDGQEIERNVVDKVRPRPDGEPRDVAKFADEIVARLEEAAANKDAGPAQGSAAELNQRRERREVDESDFDDIPFGNDQDK